MNKVADLQIDSLIQQWDGEATILHKDPPTGAIIVIAAHSSVLGPSAGGTRLKPYPTLAEAVKDAQRLAEGMTLKFVELG